MITIERQIIKRYKDGDISTKDLADYLLRTYPVTEISLALAEIIGYEADFKPIIITPEEFNQHFRLRGTKPDGSPETRGRRRDPNR